MIEIGVKNEPLAPIDYQLTIVVKPTYLRHTRLSPETQRLPEGCHQKLPPQRSL